MVSSVNNASVLSALQPHGNGGASSAGGTTAKPAPVPAKGQPKAGELSAAALQRAAGTARIASVAQALEHGQKALAADLRTALGKAGVKLGGAVEFAVTSAGAVDIKGSDADKAAVQSFLKADTGQPSFASRIATQARDALKLASTIQQSAAISQAAKLSKTSGGVVSLYNSLVQQAGSASVVFSVSSTSSSLTYPGSLAVHA